jgi:tetratricopeptide (TPR) repeat protein
VRLDPLSVVWRMGVGHMLYLARRYGEAVETELNALEVDPQFWLAHWVLGMAYEQLGDASRAVAALRQADDLSGGNPMVLGILGRSLSLLGQTDDARQILNRLTPVKLRDAPAADVVALIHTGWATWMRRSTGSNGPLERAATCSVFSTFHRCSIRSDRTPVSAHCGVSWVSPDEEGRSVKATIGRRTPRPGVNARAGYAASRHSMVFCVSNRGSRRSGAATEWRPGARVRERALSR